MKHRLFLSMTVLLLLGVQVSIAQQFPPAQVINDEGGAVAITGSVTYTNPFFTAGVAAPLVILEDQAGFVDRNESYIFPKESQTLAQITSDFYTSPFTYSLALPIEPQGTLRDVDQDGQTDLGVMIFAIAYWDNTWGDPFLEERDQQGGGWSTAYASTRVSDNPERLREIDGGRLLIYATEAGQGFPSDFGSDGLLFTSDDLIVGVPQGYTVVDLDARPFTFDRARYQVVDLIEPEGAALVDFSSLGYTAAFDAMVDKLRKEYAFTEYKGIDWDSVIKKYRARFEQADATGDSQIYLDALSEIIWSIPDGHVSVRPLGLFRDRILAQIEGGLGFTMAETDDRRAFVIFTTSGGPAEQAGMTYGAEIISINGRPVADAVTRASTANETFSTPHNRRLAQVRYATRFPLDAGAVSVEFRNPGQAVQTANLTLMREFDSFLFSPYSTADGFELPLEYRLLPNGLAYVKIYSFFDNQLLTIQLWERMIQTTKDQGITGLIIDMRENGGGSGFLADQMTAYFFSEPLVVGQRGAYNPDIDAFFFDPRYVQKMYLPAPELRFDGDIAVLIGPDCASACERFSYNMTLQQRAEVIGFYPTAGLGGSVDDFIMPEGLTVRFTAGRSLNAEGEIHIEGTGVAPTTRIPVTSETLLSDRDVLLDAASAALGAR